MILGIRATCQPRFNLSDEVIDDVKKGNFRNDMDLKVISFLLNYDNKKFT